MIPFETGTRYWVDSNDESHWPFHTFFFLEKDQMNRRREGKNSMKFALLILLASSLLPSPVAGRGQLRGYSAGVAATVKPSSSNAGVKNKKAMLQVDLRKRKVSSHHFLLRQKSRQLVQYLIH
jgi:hypothetical protein